MIRRHLLFSEKTVSSGLHLLGGHSLNLRAGFRGVFLAGRHNLPEQGEIRFPLPQDGGSFCAPSFLLRGREEEVAFRSGFASLVRSWRDSQEEDSYHMGFDQALQLHLPHWRVDSLHPDNLPVYLLQG